MGVIRAAQSVLERSAELTLAAAGAVGGATVNGVLGGVRGTADGIKAGVNNGSHSTPAAVLALAAVGAVGLVEWPLLIGVGGAALLVRRAQRGGDATKPSPGSGPARSSTKKPKRASAKSGRKRRDS